MKIIGIDPGYINTGYGLLELNIKNEIIVIKHGTIKFKNKNKYYIMKNIYDYINNIIIKYSINILITENLFLGKNFNSIIKVNFSKDSAILAALNNNINIIEYNTRRVKKNITNINNANKKIVKDFVKIKLNINYDISYDESDALALCLVYIFDIINNNKIIKCER